MKAIIERRIRRKGFATDVEAKAYIDTFHDAGRITDEEKDYLYQVVEEVYKDQ